MQSISRAQAKAEGLKHYFTGIPCKHGHVSLRYVSGGRCAACKQLDPGQYADIGGQSVWVNTYHLHTNYGLTLDWYVERWPKGCEICETPFDPDRGTRSTTACVDHCHGTKEVRGLLCHRCNIGIGKFKDDPKLFAKAVSYLDKYGKV